jgi:hypothetical protein
MFVNDSLTATLLFSQFYFFTALILIPCLLAFPGVFAPTGLIGGLQSTSWLFFSGTLDFPCS